MKHGRIVFCSFSVDLLDTGRYSLRFLDAKGGLSGLILSHGPGTEETCRPKAEYY